MSALKPGPVPERASGTVEGRALRELRNWARAQGGEARALALDLRTGKALFSLDAGAPVNPASTQKLLTAAAALSLLGPQFRFKTELWVERGAHPNKSQLTLVGGGAPDFTLADLRQWVDLLPLAGVHAIGEIIVDQSLFSGSPWPPAYDEQPGEWAAFRAPVSAFSLERNAITLHVLPAASEGDKSFAWLSPPGLSTLRGEVKTGGKTSGDRVRWDLVASKVAPGLQSTLAGTLAVGASPRTYSRRIDDPTLAPGLALRALLPTQNPEELPRVTLGVLNPQSRERLSQERSAPLASLVRELGKDSDNFTAEMLAIALSSVGAAADAAWSTERGMKVLHNWLEELGLNLNGIVLRNGSGLFGANKVSCELLVGVLAQMVRGSSVAPEYLSQLAIGGVDGTLRERFGRASWAERVRAKTGTLRDTDALAGYLFAADRGPPIVFSIVVSGVKGQHGEARRHIDRVVAELLQSESAKPSTRPTDKATAPAPPD